MEGWRGGKNPGANVTDEIMNKVYGLKKIFSMKKKTSKQIFHLNQTGFIPDMYRYSVFMDSFTVIYDINILKTENI